MYASPLPKYFKAMKNILHKPDRFFRGNWHLAVLDFDKGRWLVKTEHLQYLKAQNAKGRHIIMQPDASIEPFYLLADDLDADLIQRHHHKYDSTWKPGRLVVETSPGNFQVRIRSERPLKLDEKKFWLRKMHSDPAASPKHRWGRCPGFFNKKAKYLKPDGSFPLAKLIWVDWKNFVKIPLLQLKTFQKKTIPVNYKFSPLPGRDVCRISRSDYDRHDLSATDFAYALALARRNCSKEMIKKRLLLERSDWKNHSGEYRKNSYLDRTIEKAIRIVQAH